MEKGESPRCLNNNPLILRHLVPYCFLVRNGRRERKGGGGKNNLEKKKGRKEKKET